MEAHVVIESEKSHNLCATWRTRKIWSIIQFESESGEEREPIP